MFSKVCPVRLSLEENRMKKNKKVYFLLFFYIALALVAYRYIENSIFTQHIVTAEYTVGDNVANLPTIPFEEVQSATMNDVFTLKNEESTAIGALSIPELTLAVPIFPGISQSAMLIGAASMYPSRNPLKENMIFLGHHLSEKGLLFGKLVDAKKGQHIDMTYLGKSYHYVISEKKIIDEKEVNYIEENPVKTVTLLTCDKAAATTKRILVKAKMIEDTQTALTKKQLSAKEPLQMIEQVNKKAMHKVYLQIALFGLFAIVGTGVVLFSNKI